jgi:hypothetical protein
MWVPGETTVLRDAKGFVLTGRNLLANAAYARIRKERREPMPLRDQRARRVRGGRRPRRRDEPGGVGRGRGLDAGAICSRIPGTDLNRFTLFVVSSSRDLVGRALLEMKHECDA